MAQTSYPTAPSIAIEGMLANLSPHTIESRTNSASAAQISFGKLVKEDTLAPAVGVQPCTSAIDVPAGIAVHSHAYERGTELDASGVKPTGSINMLRKGPLYVLAGATIATGDRLAYNPTTEKFVPTHVGHHDRHHRASCGARSGCCRWPVCGRLRFHQQALTPREPSSGPEDDHHGSIR